MRTFNHSNDNSDLDKTFKYEFCYSILKAGFSYNVHDTGSTELKKR